MTDAQLEESIHWAKLRCQVARTPKLRRAAFDDMRKLIAQRSPEQIARMERERGLRR